LIATNDHYRFVISSLEDEEAREEAQRLDDKRLGDLELDDDKKGVTA